MAPKLLVEGENRESTTSRSGLVSKVPVPAAQEATESVESPPFTPPAEDLIEKKVQAYRVQLVEQSKTLAIEEGLEFIPRKLVQRSRLPTAKVEGRWWKGLLGVVGGILAGACLSNLMQMIIFEQPIPRQIGLPLVFGLVGGVALIAMGIKK